MKTKQYRASWRSDRAEQKFRAADDARWERATSNPPEVIDVPTSFGSTRVHHWPGDGADIVLLHGVGDTSVRWVPYAEALVEHNVYAIDVMGDVGRSTPDIGFESAADYGTWLAETIDSLDLATPHIVGMSLGGYVALSYVVQGGAAASVVLLDPVGVAELKMFGFVSWGAKAALASMAPAGIRHWAARRIGQPLLHDKADLKVHMRGMRGHPMKLPPLPVFTDEELASIDRPVRLVAGANSPAFDGAEMVRRASDLLSDGHVHLLPDAGHGLAMTHHDECVVTIRSAVLAAAAEGNSP